LLWKVVDGPKEWVGTKISWDLRKEGERSIVMFKHEGWREPVEFRSDAGQQVLTRRAKGQVRIASGETARLKRLEIPFSEAEARQRLPG